MNSFTCVCCCVRFENADIQRIHCKTDWHLFNLKRRIAQMTPVTSEDFRSRVLLSKSIESNIEAELNSSFYCNVCRKQFGNEKAFENHEQSRKHKDKVRHSDMCEDEIIIKQKRKEREAPTNEFDQSTEEEMNRAIILEECIFCEHLSLDVNESLEHMAIEHSFFIPDIGFCLDVSNLLEYLLEKVKKYFICLYCSDSGKEFYSLEAVRKHMHSKGHCKIDDRHMEEYFNFYDYADVDKMIIDDGSNNENMDFELVLPDGRTLGHRSLTRYYKQHLNRDRQIQLGGKPPIHGVEGRNISSNLQVKQDLLEKSVVMRQAKMELNLALKANKFPRSSYKLL